ncbi:hypothetical protein pb186bvf_004647 [Paramecium bursaria]
MKVDFLTRFKGKTATVNKKEGVTGVIKNSATPIEKLSANYTFSSYLAQSAKQNLFNSHISQSTDVTPTNGPQIYTNIQPSRKFSQASQASPLKLDSSNLIKSQFINNAKPPMIPLSKTGSVSVNLDDFEFVAIPKRLIQYGLQQEIDQKPISRNLVHKSQSLDNTPESQAKFIRSEIFQVGSYQQQNLRKRSMLQAGINSLK